MRVLAVLVTAWLSTTLLAADRDPLAGRVAGTPQQCISYSSTGSQGPSIVDPHTILYRDGSRIYRTGPRGNCPSLRPLSTLVVHIYGSQLCRNDRFEVLTPGTTIPSASCLFTDFTPFEKAR